MEYTRSSRGTFKRTITMREIEMPAPTKDEIACAYNVIRRDPAFRTGGSPFSHQRVLPYATFSPWLDDREFLSTLNDIEGYTLVDIYRLFELWELGKQCARLGGDFIEVGVWRGGSGALLARVLTHCKSQKKIYLADTFCGVVKADAHLDTKYVGGEHADTTEATVHNLMQRCSLSNYVIFGGVFPEDSSDAIPSGQDEHPSFSLCHVDVDVYRSARDVFEWAARRLKVGGVIIFDDYGFSGCEGITLLCDELKHDGRFIFVHNLNGHGIFVRAQ